MADGGTSSHTVLPEKPFRSLEPEDMVGRIFPTLEEARTFYNRYAKEMGFSIRARDLKRNSAGLVRMKEWCCNKKGEKLQKHRERDDLHRAPRDEIRCNCFARFRVILDHSTEEWVVSIFETEHSHELTNARHVHYLNSHRGLTDGDVAQVVSMRNAGIRPMQIMEYMVKQAGGRANLGFVKRDLYNLLGSCAAQEVTEGDAMRALGFLDSKKERDDGCIHEYTATEDGRLGNLFWCDTMCRYDYLCFGDVMSFDATYKTNRYKRPLVMLLGVNHHFRTCFFGCALLLDETTETYTWFLETFLRAMEHKIPGSVITDGCFAMAAALRAVMPSATHRLCEWHLERNCMANLRNNEFIKEFKEIVRLKDPTRFDDEWHKVISRHGLLENLWVRDYLYCTREKWADAFLKGHFFAQQHTTQRCESMNSHQHTFMGTHLMIHRLVQDFDAEFKRLREGEALEDHKTAYGAPLVKGPLAPMEAHAVSVYTRAIYRKFKFQMDLSHGVVSLAKSVVGTTHIYTVSKYLREHNIEAVAYDESTGVYACSCMFFESVGYPCRHLIHVLKERHLEEIPDCLILKRWTRAAKDLYWGSASNASPVEFASTVRHGTLSSISGRMC